MSKEIVIPMKCKYYNKHLETIKEYIGCLYNLPMCGSGGLLHILLDDDNYDDDDILFCLKECITNPGREESKIGKLICEEYLSLSMEQRRLLTVGYIGNFMCLDRSRCHECFIASGEAEQYD